MTLVRPLQAGLFALTGVLFFLYRVVADPSYNESPNQSERKYVLGFSGTLLSLAFALPAFGRAVGGRWVPRLALVGGAGVALSSVANVFEDGLQMSWVFFVFIAGVATCNLALLVLTVVIALTRRGGYRLLALIPAATLAAVILFVIAGGVIMLVTWLTAATVALTLPIHAAAQAAPESHSVSARSTTAPR